MVRLPNFLCVAFLLCISDFVYGFQVNLSNDTFDVVGSGKSRSLLIENKNTELLAVEVSVVSRSIDIDGAETLGDSSPDFDVYPSQLLINPGEDAVVGIVWKGTIPDKEKAYRVVSKEIAYIDESVPQQGKMQLLIGRRYLHAAYVAPPGVSPKINLESVAVSSNREVSSNAEMVVTLKNAGSAHQIISNAELKIVGYTSALNEKITLKSPLIVSLSGEKGRFNLLAGSSFKICIPWPVSLPMSAKLESELINVR